MRPNFTKKLNDKHLRFLVRKIIQEGPLADLNTGKPAYARGQPLSDRQKNEFDGWLVDTRSASIGFKRALEFTNAAKDIFKNTRHKWAVIMPPHTFLPTESPDTENKTYEKHGLLGLAKDLGIPNGTKIIVVGSGQFSPNDYSEIEWTLRHDTIGHALMISCLRGDSGNKYKQILREIAGDLVDSNMKYGQILIKSLRNNRIYSVANRLFNVYFIVAHSSLPEVSKVSKDGQADIAPDVFASIFLEDIEEDSFISSTREKIIEGQYDELISELSEGSKFEKIESRRIFADGFERCMNFCFRDVRDWSENFPIDEPTVIKQW